MDSSKEFQLMLDEAIKSEPLAFRDFDKTKNVQDQLQEMYLKSMPDGTYQKIATLAEEFHDYHETNGYPLWVGSMEQLWLAFYQQAVNNKVWIGEKWT